MMLERHPRGLATLFFTEMWERLSYYGMRALLVLFMVDQVERGGMGLTDEIATAIYGLYTAAAYLGTLPGGWIADRLLGSQRAIWYGGILIATGHFVLGIPNQTTFFLGLILVVLGTGLLKPNISAVVGDLYPEGGARRDAGFSIFYMGINLGGFLGPLVCSYLGEKINWHYGFTAAGVGMLFGLIQFYFTGHYLGDAGRHPPQKSAAPARDWSIIGLTLVALALLFVFAYGGWIRLNPVLIADWTSWFIVAVALLYFAWTLLFAGLTPAERGRVIVIGVLFIAAAMFWAGFEQAGSSLNLFAERSTMRTTWLPRLTAPTSWFQFEVPAGWFQSINAILIIIFAPVFAALWVALARRNIAPSLITKMAWGLLLLALGFLVIALGAKRALAVGAVWPTWLITMYLVHTWGELCLSPVGLSAVTKLSPPRLVGQMMGVWFLGASLGNLLAGRLAGLVTGENLDTMPLRFFQVVLTAGLTGIILLALARPMNRLAGGVQ
jgi:POT family proton-dependent oligopeptide transporter